MNWMKKSTDEEWLSPSIWSGRAYLDSWTTVASNNPVVEPATGNKLGDVGFASAEDIKTAAAKAKAAQEEWAALPPGERTLVLRKAAQAAEANQEEIVTWIMRESGSVRPKAEFEAHIATKALWEASALPSQASGLMLPSEAGRLNIARRRPMGVVGVISPFNFPLYLAMRAVAPALALGNAVVLKPDPRTSICGGFSIARIFETAGLPQGLLHVLPGAQEAGEALCSDDNVSMIAFTGSTRAGRAVGEMAGKHLKKVSLELGGKNSLVILDDADMELAIKNACWSVFLHQGQICMAAGRMLVHRNIIDEFSQLLAEKAKVLPVGDPMTNEVALGPIINENQVNHIQSIVDASVEQGAQLLAGGTSQNLFYAPTVLTNVTKDMPAYNDEIFGPVAVVVPFDTDEEAIAMANDTQYGLSGAVITNSLDRAMNIGEKLHVGLMHINDQTVNDEVTNPFGGYGKSGNGMSIGGPANWEDFTHWQWMTVKGAPPAYPF